MLDGRRHRRRASRPHELPRLFERFHRVEGARGAHARRLGHRPRAGAGAGASCTAATSRSTSELGTGTTFTVSHSAGRAHLAARAHRRRARERRRAVDHGARRSSKEALRWLAGADPDVQPSWRRRAGDRAPTRHARRCRRRQRRHARLRARACSRDRWEVEAVADGAQALAAVRRARPDLVLTDVMMPELDGFGLLRGAARRSRARATFPVIMLSARAGEEARIEGLQAGADDYLVKPFSARELLARVEAQLLRARDAAPSRTRRRRAALRDIFTQAPVAHRHPARVRTTSSSWPTRRTSELVGQREVVGKPIREALPELAGQGDLRAARPRVRDRRAVRRPRAAPDA